MGAKVSFRRRPSSSCSQRAKEHTAKAILTLYTLSLIVGNTVVVVSPLAVSSCNFVRFQSTLTLEEKVQAPPMVYIQGEEMTHYATELLIDQWIKPYFTLEEWKTFDLSCKNRDATDDQVLQDAVDAGKRIGAIFKEPTITPSALQVSNEYCICFQ